MFFLVNTKLLVVMENTQFMPNEKLMEMECGGSFISTQMQIVGNSNIQALKQSQELVFGAPK